MGGVDKLSVVCFDVCVSRDFKSERKNDVAASFSGVVGDSFARL